jgi:hypothetical protein
MKKVFLLSACIAAMAASTIGCKKKTTTTPPAPTPTLYTRVGGSGMVTDPAGGMIEAGRLTLRSVVDSSILVIAADPNMAKFFPVLFAELGAGNTTGLMQLSKKFTDFLCTATGCTNTSYGYTGLSMKVAHNPALHSRMGAKANSAEFDAFVGHIGTGLAKNGVTSANNKALVDDLVALLYTTKADIVQN